MFVIDTFRYLCPWAFPRKPEPIDMDKLIQMIRTVIYHKGVRNFRSDAVLQVMTTFKSRLPLQYTEAVAREIADAIDSMQLGDRP